MFLKPEADAEGVRALVREQLGGEVGEVRPLAGGQFSRAFAFSAEGREYVVRLAGSEEGFAKDLYAWRHFASPDLPIPRVAMTGRGADGWFAISERVPGRTLDELSPAERLSLLPALLDTLDVVARTDVRASWGYGGWDAGGTGGFASWHEYLAAAIENGVEGFHKDWHRLFRDSFLERDVYEAVYGRMLRLAAYYPEERALVHNDYNFENVLTDGRRITGVIDWANACYGDPLYDVAWLGWWSVDGWWYEGGAGLLRERYGAAPFYDERMACYECHIGLDELRYLARMGQRERYERVRDRLLALVAGDAAGG